MDIIRRCEECESLHLRELARSDLIPRQIALAVKVLSGWDYVDGSIRNMCCGAYVLSKKAPDELYHRLKKPIRCATEHITRADRDRLITILRSLDTSTEQLTAGLRKLQCEASNEKQLSVELPPPIYNEAGDLSRTYLELLENV